MQSPGSSASAIASTPYPERFHLALRYGEQILLDSSRKDITDADKLLLYALTQQAVHGPNTDPKPSMFDSEARAKWNAWRELGDQKRSSQECMVLYVNAVEELAPEWYKWPPLGLCQPTPASDVSDSPAATGGGAGASDAGDAEEDDDAEQPRTPSSKSDDTPQRNPNNKPQRPADEDAALIEFLDGRLSRRASAPPPTPDEAEADAALAVELANRLPDLLSASPRQRNVPRLIATLHSLACLAALGGPPRTRILTEAIGGRYECIDLAMRAATQQSAENNSFALPIAVQHLSLMILVNVTIAAAGASKVGRAHSQLLQSLADSAEDPRSRSLARCVLDNVAQHSGLLHHLTRRQAPGKLQLATPASMLRTFARLDQSCFSAAPPVTPGNRQIPDALSEAEAEAAAEAAIEAAAAAAAAAAHAAEEEAAAAAKAAEAQAASIAAANNGHSHPESPELVATTATPPPPPPEPEPEPELSIAAAPAPSAAYARAEAMGLRPRAAQPLLPPPTPATPLPPPSPPPRATPTPPATTAAADAALDTLRSCARELHEALGLKPVARATAPWGIGKAGVVVSSLAYALQHAPPERADLVGAILYEAAATSAIFDLLEQARYANDDAGIEGALWCLASLSHLCGGRTLFGGLHASHHEQLLFDTLNTAATPQSAPAILLALAALRAAAADPLSVRRVARQLKRVQELFRSDNNEIALLACAVVANVEQYSHARLWYARSHSEAAQLLDAPAPPPPPPLVLYSQAPITPALLCDMAEANLLNTDNSVLSVPQLACQLHPWIQPSLRRSAVLKLASTLLAAWQRGTHDAVLLYLLEASLVPRRLGFVLSRDFANDDPARYALLLYPYRPSTTPFAQTHAHAHIRPPDLRSHLLSLPISSVTPNGATHTRPDRTQPIVSGRVSSSMAPTRSNGAFIQSLPLTPPSLPFLSQARLPLCPRSRTPTRRRHSHRNNRAPSAAATTRMCLLLASVLHPRPPRATKRLRRCKAPFGAPRGRRNRHFARGGGNTSAKRGDDRSQRSGESRAVDLDAGGREGRARRRADPADQPQTSGHCERVQERADTAVGSE